MKILRPLIVLSLINLFLISTTSAQNFEYKNLKTSIPLINTVSPGDYLFEAKPGTTVTDTILVKNLDTVNELPIRIYGADKILNKQGDMVFSNYSQDPKEMRNWITINNKPETLITLAPDEEKLIKFKVHIPAETKNKEYKGGLMIESLNYDQHHKTDKEKDVTIKTNARIGYDVIVKVTDNPQPIEKIDPNAPKPLPWQYIYFGVSIGLMVIACGYLLFKYLKKKKQHLK